LEAGVSNMGWMERKLKGYCKELFSHKLKNLFGFIEIKITTVQLTFLGGGVMNILIFQLYLTFFYFYFLKKT
jgi:hypothetical protein